MSWMQKVAYGHIPNPGVLNIELIDQYRREKQRSKKKTNGRTAASSPSQHHVSHQ